MFFLKLLQWTVLSRLFTESNPVDPSKEKYSTKANLEEERKNIYIVYCTWQLCCFGDLDSIKSHFKLSFTTKIFWQVLQRLSLCVRVTESCLPGELPLPLQSGWSLERPFRRWSTPHNPMENWFESSSLLVNLGTLSGHRARTSGAKKRITVFPI